MQKLGLFFTLVILLAYSKIAFCQDKQEKPEKQESTMGVGQLVECIDSNLNYSEEQKQAMKEYVQALLTEALANQQKTTKQPFTSKKYNDIDWLIWSQTSW